MKFISIPTLAERDRTRFLSKVALPDEHGCCLWTATKNPGGYGLFSVGGRKMKAHRVSYTLFVGPIPDGLEIDHRCHVHSCVAPMHLRPVTRSENHENRVGAQINNKSGVLGVSPYGGRPGSPRWQAQIQHDGQKTHLGYFDTVEEAEAAAVAGRLALFTHNDLDRVPLPSLTQLR